MVTAGSSFGINSRPFISIFCHQLNLPDYGVGVLVLVPGDEFAVIMGALSMQSSEVLMEAQEIHYI